MPNTIRTEQIADELVRIIRDTTVGITWGVVQIGTLDLYRGDPDISSRLPAALVTPWTIETDLRNNANSFTTMEAFRIVYVREIPSTLQIEPDRALAQDVRKVFDALAAEPRLASLNVGPLASIYFAHTRSVDWRPPENKFAAEFQVPVRMAALTHLVRMHC